MSAYVTQPPTGDRSAAAFWRRFAPRTVRIPRARVRTVLWVGLGAAALYVLLPQVGGLGDSLVALSGAQPGWIAAGLALVAVRYALAAVSLQAVVREPLAFWPTLLVQLASSFVGRFTPEGLGWLVLNQRYLERSGIERASGLAAITVKLVAGGLMRLLIAIGVAAMAAASGVIRFEPPTPSGADVLVGGLTLAAAVGVAWAIRSRVPRVGAAVARAGRDLAAVLRQPDRAAVLLGSTAALTVAYGLVLSTSITAFGVGTDIVAVFAVYLGATAVAALSPTPGNLGAIEVALIAGLSAVGVPGPLAVTSVLLFRFLTFWLPVVPGFFAFRFLQNKGLL